MSSLELGVVPGGTSGVMKWLLLRGVVPALCSGVLVLAPAAAEEEEEQVQAAAAALDAAEPDVAVPPVDAVALAGQARAAYRALGARHLYDLYRERIFKGQLPPLLYAIAIVETEVDDEGKVVNTVVTREPAAAKEVIPWILGLIRSASPFPRPERPGGMRYEDVWLVDRDYTFQLHTLTEGQR